MTRVLAVQGKNISIVAENKDRPKTAEIISGAEYNLLLKAKLP